MLAELGATALITSPAQFATLMGSGARRLACAVVSSLSSQSPAAPRPDGYPSAGGLCNATTRILIAGFPLLAAQRHGAIEMAVAEDRHGSDAHEPSAVARLAGRASICLVASAELDVAPELLRHFADRDLKRHQAGGFARCPRRSALLGLGKTPVPKLPRITIREGEQVRNAFPCFSPSFWGKSRSIQD
jgi:hypothetical protein